MAPSAASAVTVTTMEQNEETISSRTDRERARKNEASPGMGISFLLEAFFGTQTDTRAVRIKASEGTPRDGV